MHLAEHVSPDTDATPPTSTEDSERVKSSAARFDGYEQAARSGAVPASLKTCLIKIRRDYQGDQEPKRHDCLSQAKVLRERSAVIEGTLPGLRSYRQEDGPRIKDLRRQQKELEQEAETLKPADLGEYDAMTFWPSVLLILGLSVYLFVFYTSAGYSAFFKNIGEEITRGTQSDRVRALFSSIFDAGALTEAVRTHNLFVVFFPAVFLSLGFVIHRLYERRQVAGAAVFLLVAFAFDVLIAYQIASKLFAAEVMTGLKEGQFTMRVAAVDVNFWSVIAAGFVVYIVWTFVLGFLLREMRSRADLRRAIHERRRRIEAVTAEIRQIEAQREEDIRSKEEELRVNRVEIERLNAEADGRIVWWPELEDRIETFALGWLCFLVGTTESPAERTARTDEARAIVDEFKTSVQREFSGGRVVTLKDGSRS